MLEGQGAMFMRQRVDSLTQTAAAALAAGAVLAGSGTAAAQSSWASEGAVVQGHYHLNVTDRAAHARFWGDALGGVPTPFGETTMFKFPHTLVFLTDRKPTGGTIGTAINHIGFWVPNTRAMVDKIRSAGFPIITAREASPTADVKDGVVCSESQNTCIAYVLGPDDIKVEIVENRSQTRPIQNHHIHVFTPKVDELRAWYVETFGAVPGMNGSFKVVDLPGTNIRFSESTAVVGTRGRTLDHIAFEVDNLEAFCKRLEARGIKFDRPYTMNKARTIGFAIITDPNGTAIELTEGMDKL